MSNVDDLIPLTERDKITVLRRALARLRNEVAGLCSAYELGLREEIGNTNFQCMVDRLEEARAVIERTERFNG